MRILELEIQNLRGIRSLRLSPQGSNFVVWGPNGAGKSAVIDAIDFLLTGSMTRLSGPGTRAITLRRHGAHIDADPSEAFVRAVVRMPNESQPITLLRMLDSPGNVQVEGKAERIGQVLSLAEKGQHVLTRREILRFITAEAGTRAQQIQVLLNLGDIENVRKRLVTIKNETRNAASGVDRSFALAQGRIASHIGSPSYRPDALHSYVNEQRALLGGEPISEVSSDSLKSDLTFAAEEESGSGLTIEPLRRACVSVRNILLNREELEAARDSLENATAQLVSDQRLLEDLATEDLTRRGLEMLGDGVECPLCGTEWPVGELAQVLEERLQRAQRAASLGTQVDKALEVLRSTAGTVAAALGTVLEASHITLEDPVREALAAWAHSASEAIGTYVRPSATQFESWEPASVEAVLGGTSGERLAEVEALVAEQEDPTRRRREAWDSLTRLEEALGSLEAAEATRAAEQRVASRATLLHDRFCAARDQVLQATYDRIRERFEGLYRDLHEHEESFRADLRPEGAGLNLEVDFLGRGLHPPHALHSEGHQDSMGICLFLALTERLTAGVIDLVMLDDVMMSVDADHRRALAGLLATAFPHRQLVITTHDRSWEGQLRTEGVVRSRFSFHFADWDVEAGPRVTEEENLWSQIDEDLAADNIPGAAHKLRRGAEDFLSHASDRLGAPVRYQLSGRVELGDLVQGALPHFRNLIKKGKAAAQSWGNTETMEMLAELDSIVGQVLARTQAEQWAINENVHYNNWANFSASDLWPVVDAFRDLFELLLCSQCASQLAVTYVGANPSTVNCTCGNVNWTLVPKS